MGAVRLRAKTVPALGNGDARAGLYAGLLPARLLAEALKMSLEEMGKALKNARERLELAGLQMGEPSLEQAL